jgi:hypothetical protein
MDICHVSSPVMLSNFTGPRKSFCYNNGSPFFTILGRFSFNKYPGRSGVDWLLIGAS